MIYQAHYHKDRQDLMNQTPTMSEPLISMITMMDYDSSLSGVIKKDALNITKGVFSYDMYH